MLVRGDTELPFKPLESDRGFLVYVAGAYPAMKPYLKGFHLTLDMWRGGRDEEGWRIRGNLLVDTQSVLDANEGGGTPHGPLSGMTPVAPRFKTDLEALICLTDSPTPARRVVRRRDLVTALYGFGDASSGGFGASMGFAQGVHGRYGIWGSDVEDKSSNYRELRNLVETIEEEVAAGRLTDAKLWMFTDNTTAEGCFAKGSSRQVCCTS